MGKNITDRAGAASGEVSRRAFLSTGAAGVALAAASAREADAQSGSQHNWDRSADVVACTPWYEPFGLTPLEAMACGVPVVTYAVGGLQDSVVDGVTGLHVRPGDVSALIGALRRLLGGHALRQRFSRAALAMARSQLSWDTTAAKLVDVYSDVVIRRTQPAKVAP